MAMRNYGIQSKCMVLDIKDFYNLLAKQELRNNEIFNFMYNEKGILPLEEIGFSDFIEISYNIQNACFFSEISGSFTILDEQGFGDCIYFNDKDLIIFELEKDSLFKSYDNFEEIYEEIINNFNEVGIKIDKEYVKEHFGVLEGTYFA